MTGSSIYEGIQSARAEERIEIPPGIPNEFANLDSVVKRNVELIDTLVARLRPIIKYSDSAADIDGYPKTIGSSDYAHAINTSASIIANQNDRLMNLLSDLDL